MANRLPGHRRLIPVTSTQWSEEVSRALWLDEPVSVRVYKVR